VNKRGGLRQGELEENKKGRRREISDSGRSLQGGKRGAKLILKVSAPRNLHLNWRDGGMKNQGL